MSMRPVATLRSLITLSRGDVDRARDMLGSQRYEHSLPAMRAEYFAARSLVLACSGKRGRQLTTRDWFVRSRQRSNRE